MNTTEDRLRAAMSAVGDTLGPEDIRPLSRPRGRWFHPSWRTALMVSAASVAAVVVGVSLATGSGDSGASRPATGSSPSDQAMPGTTASKNDVSIILCQRMSANPACDRTDVSAAQRDSIRTDLQAIPTVREFEFVSSGEAYERLRKELPHDPVVMSMRGPEEVAESFQVVVRNPDDYRSITNAFLGRPGVDQIITWYGPAIKPPEVMPRRS
ncbi:permease-like cell division protein FtsX [Actinomadura sp. HBU206391]|uniref:permease-like cell division protein FtsX n=1 Tax=Actinomadura sp. HBU206391 TaxID=2731692 RepID=UPI00164FBB79|nr:permease-like cell division protein FtsX [Actinomadura sp. HBU206391]MBC6460357.1 hypothetical protein [Actinomadura sp. HBU206391]